MALNTIALAARHVRGPTRARRALRQVADLVEAMGRDAAPGHLVKAGRRYFSHLYAPGWPSRAFDRHLAAELIAAASRDDDPSTPLPHPRLQTVIFAVTRRCELRCLHCSEWDRLNEPDRLTVDDLHAVVAALQSLGVVQIHFTGGEPLERRDDLIQVLRGARPGTDFWLFTSGMGLTASVAASLRKAGLTGVNLSLDHWRPEAHDAFRGRDGAFAWVVRAARAADKAKLAVGLSLCATRNFVSDENLRRYAELARELGAGFIQVLEPYPEGRFAGKDVALAADAQRRLERFRVEMNRGRRSTPGPIVVYPAGDQRRVGCLGAGRRFAFIDADGRFNPCPFCHRPTGNALAGDLAGQVRELRRLGCPVGADACLAPRRERKGAP